MGLYDRYVDTVTGLFRQGVEQGQFDRIDPLFLTLSLEGILNAFVAYWSKREPTEPLAVLVTKMKRDFLGRLKVRLSGPDDAAQR